MDIAVFDRLDELPYNRAIFGECAGIALPGHADRFTHWWFYADRNGLNSVEYLLPQLRVKTEVSPFTFESSFGSQGRTPPSQVHVDSLGPWAYQVEMGPVQTVGQRNDADWLYHRYRKSVLIDSTKQIVGASAGALTVLDVACHCGVFSLEFAAQGFRHVTGLDLRPGNIAQARFLGDQFGLPDVYFCEANARDIMRFPPSDIVFCGGLLYHVTFPMELLRNLYLMTREFLVLDTVCHKHPIAGFHLVANKDVDYSAEGEFHYEFHPTYRAVCDGLQAVGFRTIYELVGSGAGDVPNYKEVNVRSFVAVKNEGGIFRDFLQSVAMREASR